MRVLKSVSIAVLCVFAMTTAFSQEVTGTINGAVLDASGSPIPGATITVTNIARGQVLATVSTAADGQFTAPLLPVGPYTVAAEAKGFKKVVQKDIDLHVGDKLGLRFDLPVGDVAEQVTVEATALAVQTESSTAEGLVSGGEVRELALNNRNYIQLISLMPGVTNNAATDEIYIGTTNPLGSTNTIPFSLNGGRTSANNYMVDGADNIDRGSNLTLLAYPSVDAIAEFKVLRGTYSAEYGRGAAGQINVVTRGGGKDFHGGGYEFFRNDKLAANDYFSNFRNIPRKPLRYNNFGYNIGGPVILPGYNKDRNKTFFFFSQEYRRVITYSTFNALAPSDDLKKGVFSQPVCVDIGFTCNATATQIAPAQWNPVAKQYFDGIWSKLPSGDPTNSFNLYTPLRSVYNARQEFVRIDHRFTDNLNVFVRYLKDTIPTEEPGGLFTGNPYPGLATTKTDSPGKGWVARGNWNIRPSLIADVGFSYSYGAIVSRILGLMDSTKTSINVPLPFKSTLNRIPNVSISGLSGLSGYGPYDDFNRNYNTYVNLVKLAGRHTLKFGTSINYYSKTENASGNNAASFTFSNTPRPTGTLSALQGWANFLLGNASAFSQASLDLTPYIRQRQLEGYVQDDFKWTRNFTVNIGVRYSLFRQPFDANGMLTNFDPSKYDPSKAPKVDPATGLLVLNTGDPLNGILTNNGSSPYGTKIAPESKGGWAPRIGFSWDPSGRGLWAIRSGYGISYDSMLVGVYEQNIFQNPPYVNSVTINNTRFENPAAGTTSISASPKVLRGTPNSSALPYTQQWSFDVQHQLTPKTMIDLGYFGSKSTHLIGIVDLNQIPVGAAVAAGIMNPSTPLTSATSTRLNAIRPYQGYNAINMIQPWFNSNYNSMQLSAQQRMAGNATIRLSYTWSRAMTDATSDRSNAPQYTYARNLDYARATFDRTHVATLSYIYPIPFGRGSNAVVRNLIGGWQLSGIATFMTGSPLRVTSGLGYDWGGIGIIGSSASSPRPDLVGDPQAGAPHTIAQWFNTAAFAAVPAGQVRPGNAAATTVIGPGTERFDTSLFKRFPIYERVNATFRFETFNTLNHTNYLGVSTSLGSTNFGQITSAREPRRVQLALKVEF